MTIPAYATGTHELWSPALIRDALVLALKVERALPGGVTYSAAMDWHFNDEWGYADDEKQNKTRFRPSATEISQMETMLIGKGHRSALINGRVMAYPDHRLVLLKWALWVSFGGVSPDGVVETDVEFARRMKVEEWTMKRMRDHAAGTMARQANEMGIVVWHAGKPERRRRAGANMHAAGN